MEVTDLYIVEEIVPDMNGRNLLVNPLNVIMPMFIPAAHSFGLVIGFIKTNPGDKIEIRIMSHDEKQIAMVPPMEIMANMIDMSVPENYRAAFLTSTVKNIVLMEEKPIIVQVYLNGEMAEEREFPVLKRKITQV